MYSYLDERRDAVRDAASAAGYRYCSQRFGPGALGDGPEWGSPTVWYEVDAAGLVARQIETFDQARFVRRFSTAFPHETGSGRGLRRDPLSPNAGDARPMSHAEFEHLWLTGFPGPRSPGDFSDDLLCCAFDEGPQKLWECWSEAEVFFPYDDAGGTLSIAAQAIERLLDRGEAELIIERRPHPPVQPLDRGLEVIRRRSSWIPHPRVALTSDHARRRRRIASARTHPPQLMT